MNNCFIIKDLETGDTYKSFVDSKEEAVIAFVRGMMKESGVDEVCDMLSITVENLEDIRTYE